MPEITPTLTIPDDELQFDFVTASGPGGQNGGNNVSLVVCLDILLHILPETLLKPIQPGFDERALFKKGQQIHCQVGNAQGADLPIQFLEG